MTRQNLIPSQSDAAPSLNALIPLWDFCNHQDGQVCALYNLVIELLTNSSFQFSTDFNPDTRETVCQANRDYGEGEQVFIYYGHRTCAEQFIHNGFVDINNAHDALAIKVGLSKSDPLAEKRTSLMFKLRIVPGKRLRRPSAIHKMTPDLCLEEKLTGPVPFQLHAGTQPVDGKLLAFLRLFCMDKDALGKKRLRG